MYQVVWNKLPQTRLRSIYNYIKYGRQEPLSADKLVSELVKFGNSLALSPKGFPEIEKLRTKNFRYRSATYRRTYRFIYRVDEKRQQIIIIDLFHNKRDPKGLKLE